MQFVVPQFIETESKVIGPISVRQFIILLASGLLIYVFWELFSFWIAAILGVFTLAVGGAFAFVKINGQPFHLFALVFVQTLKSPKLKIWHRDTKQNIKPAKEKEPKVKLLPMTAPKQVSQSRLSELSLMVDTGGAYKAEEINNKPPTQK
ncbi:MAG: PrgI family protein [Patescibacteria group bacterium]|jgi:hypothetical protein